MVRKWSRVPCVHHASHVMALKINLRRECKGSRRAPEPVPVGDEECFPRDITRPYNKRASRSKKGAGLGEE